MALDNSCAADGDVRVRTSVGIVLGQYANVLGFTSTVPILEYYTAVH